MAIYTNEHLTDLLNEQYEKVRELTERHEKAMISIGLELTKTQDKHDDLLKELQATREQLDTVVKYLEISYQWGLYLYESEWYQEMKDEDERENMKDDLDIVHSFLNKQKDEVRWV